MDLSTQYLGLTLKNPVIVASCGLTHTLDQIIKADQAGAGAVVMKSLFEEQIRQNDPSITEATMHPEALDYIRAEIDMVHGPRDYLQTIRDAKKAISIPLIASINCYSSKWWTSYASDIEAAGADALELNIYVEPFNYEKSSVELENIYLDILHSVKMQIHIPVVLKLSPYFTSLANFAVKAEGQGANGLVLFNRFIQPEIDVNKMTTTVKGSFNDPVGFAYALRWVAILSENIKADIAVSGGIKDADGMIKQLLAGASAIQIASVLYKKGLGKIQEMVDGLAEWMEKQEFSSIADFRGRLNQKNNPQSVSFSRAQYMKAITNVD